MSEPNLNAAPILNHDKQKYIFKIFYTTLTGGLKLSDEDNNLEITKFGENSGIPGLALTENQQQFLKIVQPKTELKYKEVLINLLLSTAFAFFASYQLFTVQDEGKTGYLIIGIISILVTSLSLITESPKEPFSMVGYNNHFGLLPYLYFFAIIGPFFASIMYIFEQYNFWLLGFESTVSDLRTIIFAILQSICVAILYFLYEKINLKIVFGIACALAVLLSENLLFTIGEKFNQSPQNKSIKKKSNLTTIGIIWKLIVVAILIAIGFIIPQTEPTESFSELFMIISFILGIFLKIFEYLQSAFFFVLFKSTSLQKIPAKLGKILYQISQIVSLITISALNYYYFSQLKTDLNQENLERLIVLTLLFRTYRHLFTDLQLTNLIIFETFLINAIDSNKKYLIYTPFLTIINIAIANIFRRSNLWLYQIKKMLQDKKQKIKKNTLFIALSFTLLLPLNLLAIILSSVLDTPLVPFLGLPLFVLGFPRPKRIWPSLNSVVQSTGESSLYNKFTHNFQNKLQNIVNKYQYLFTPGKFFLIRIDKYLATLQILENGREYLVINIRGSESQDPVSCHSHEAMAIDDLTKEVFEKKNCINQNFQGAALPITQFNTDGYQENQIKLTGIVEDEDFNKGFREIYLKLIVFYINKFITRSDKDMLYKLTSNIDDYINTKYTKKHFPISWANLINLDCEKRDKPIIQFKTKQVDDRIPLQVDSAQINQIRNDSDNFLAENNKKKETKANNNFDDDLFNELGFNNDNNDDLYQLNNINNNKKVNKNIPTSAQQITQEKPQKTLNLNEKPQKNQQKNKNSYINNIFDDYEVIDVNNNNKGINKNQDDEPLKFKEASKRGNHQNQQQNQTQNQNQQQQFSTQDDNYKNPSQIFGRQMKKSNVFSNPSKNFSTNQNQNQNQNNYQNPNEVLDMSNEVAENQLQRNFKPSPNQHDENQNYNMQNHSQKPLQTEQKNINSKQSLQQQDDFLYDLEDILPPGPPPPMNNTGNDFGFNDQHSQKTRNTDNNQSPDDKYETTFMKKIQQLTILIYVLSTNDLEFKNKQLNKKDIHISFDNQNLLKKCRIFNSNEKEFGKIFEIQKLAIRMALKIALDQQSLMMTAEMSDQEVKEAIDENQDSVYIGMGSDPEWQEASRKNTETLWNLHYFPLDNTLGLFISKYSTINCTLFSLNEDIVNGIWSNLQFELYYVTNDDDERYSIQTHKTFLRNIIIENAEQPLGYAPFYSGPLVVHV
ncbi:hypothetical protein PPERSA_11070 [Pseudocohnilembus persalinus]|uniref:Pecanex C-terminal domain-containing protein n=1 Tax=Pseudocohnilembus persalinus TaxID=266149 RepID=A0A0V0QZA7_PSEPJ|nr:hypothetical protein PPERSA_11070 [Pseudocohnilembus persalinus]|eukprot:KRX07521.1 hypothetical protein PPERSA_11070 [Pseudocohnilembus persalinus]